MKFHLFLLKKGEFVLYGWVGFLFLSKVESDTTVYDKGEITIRQTEETVTQRSYKDTKAPHAKDKRKRNQAKE